jgi:hypothetical protein
MDTSGNSYILGRFTGSTTSNPLSIYNRDRTKTLPDLNASTTLILSNIFLVKYDSSGTGLWRLRIGVNGGISSPNTFPYSMTIDNSNNLIIAGTFAANFPPTIYNTSDVSMVTLTINSQNTGFIAKINPNGQSVFWTKRFYNSTTTNTINPYSVKVDSQNNVYITGRYDANMTIDGTATALSIIGSTDTFIIKYDSAGTYKWATAVGNTINSDFGYKLAVDKNDNILITGAYGAALNIYDVNQTTFTRDTTAARTLSTSGSNDMFIVKYNTLGVSQWATRIGGTGADIAYSVYVDNSNNIIIGGNYATAAATFYSVGDISGLTLPVPTTTTALLGKYDTNGTFLWGTRIGSSSSTIRNGYNVVTDNQNNIYIYVNGSTSTSTIRPYDISGINYTVDFSPGFSIGLYLIKYSPSGYAQNLISIQGQIAITYFGDTVFIKNDTIFLTGHSSPLSQITFKDVSNQLINNLRLDNSGGADVFIAKVQLPTSTLYNASYNSGFNDGLIDVSNNNTAQYTANYPLITDYYTQNIYNSSYNYSKPLVVLATKDGNNDGYYRARYGSATPPFYNNNSILQRTYNIAYTERYNYYSTVQGDMKVNWATQIGGTGSSEIGYGITVDNSGYIYNVGTYNSNPNLFYNADRTLSNISLDLSGSTNSYVAKYDSSGILVWAANIQRSSISTTTYNIETDNENNIYICGIYSNASVNFYNSDNTYSNIFLDNSGGSDIFLAKYNSSGFVQWALRLAGISTDIGLFVKVDKDNNVYIAGRSTSANLFIYNYLKSLQATLNNSSNTMRFIAKFDKNGFFLWANKILGSGFANDNNYLSIDNSNNILLIGTTASSDTLRPFDTTNTQFTDLSLNFTNFGSYIYKYNSLGTPLWRSSIINRFSSNNTIMNTIDQYNNIYIVCPYQSSSPTIINSNNQNSGLTVDISTNYPYLIVKYSPDGYALWATRITNNAISSITSPSIIYSGNYLYAGIPYASSSTLYNSNGSVSPYIFDTSGQTDTMLVKYDLSGTVKWASRFGGTGQDNIINIAADKNSNIYMTGYYNSNPLNILNSDGVSALTLETTTQNAFIISYLNQATSAPSAPTGLSANTSNRTLVINFTASVSNGSPITTYEYSVNNSPTYTQIASSPITLTSLTNGASYNIKIRAVNAVGTSATSEINATPIGPPGIPTDLSGTPGDGQFTVAFSAPDSNGTPITNYQYSINNGVSWTAINPPNTNTTIIIPGLTNDISYNVRVRAVNSLGMTGLPTEPIIARAVRVPIVGQQLDNYMSTISINQENRGTYKKLIIQNFNNRGPLDIPNNQITQFITQSIGGNYNINQLPKKVAVITENSVVDITTIKGSLTSKANELYFFTEPNTPFSLKVGSKTYSLIMRSNGISYNNISYTLGQTIPLDNTYKFTINFLGSAGGLFEEEIIAEESTDTRPIRRGPMSASDRLRQLQTRTIVADVARQRAAGALPPRGSYDPTLVREAKLNYEVGAVNTTQTEFNNYKSG